VRVDTAVAIRDDDGLHVTGLDTAQPVFSVTKMFMATVVLRLAESGLLALDDEASRRVPQCPGGIMVRELLNHTGGLPDYVTDARYLDAVTARDRPWDVNRIAEVALAGRHSERGRFRYSNLGYWLLGALVKHVTGSALRDTLTDLVFTPAGMTSTTYPAAGALLTAADYDTCWAGPAGAVWSTPRDLVTFLTALQHGSLLSKESWTAMTTTTPVTTGPPWRAPGYGLGLMIDSEYQVLGHSGGGPGYTSAAFTTAARSVAIVAGPESTEDPTRLALELLG
jgi:D-alanyl-D-alanine carboxypeptidase